jgi:hypothetical protein
MPPAYVKTIREEIYYEYAKLISRSAPGSIKYPFVADRFKKLRDGQVTSSETIREWEREQELPHECVFCGSCEDLSTDHLIPRNCGGGDSSDNDLAHHFLMFAIFNRMVVVGNLYWMTVPLSFESQKIRIHAKYGPEPDIKREF